MPVIDQVLDQLVRTCPANHTFPVVCWRDARLGNLMFGPDQRVTGVLDWEMAATGRPEVDLGYLLFFDRMMSTGMGLPRLAGFPSRDATLARYAQLSGRQARQINWFEAYAGLRIAMLVTRTANKLIELGMAEDTTMSFNNPATIALADLLGLPAPVGELGCITDRGRVPVLPPIPDSWHH